MNKHIETVKFLLEQACDSIPAEYIIKALKFAANLEAPFELLNCILQNGEKLPTKSLGELFVQMCRQGKTSVVQSFMQHIGKQLTRPWKGMAFINALEQKQFSVAHLLWQAYHSELLFSHKAQAFWQGFKADPRGLLAFAMTVFFSNKSVDHISAQKLPVLLSGAQEADLLSTLTAEPAYTFAYQHQCAKTQMQRNEAKMGASLSTAPAERKAAPAA